MNIYLACTVRGDRTAVIGLRELVKDLEAGGHIVLTRHLLEDGVEDAEALLTDRAVFDRDLGWLNAADILIADATGSSFGVGFEVGWVLARSERTSQRVVLLYRADRKDRISRLIGGNAHPRCEVMPYADTTDLITKVRAALI